LIDKAVDTGLSEDWLIEWKSRERRLIRENLITAPVHWLDLPTKPDVDRIGRDLVDKLTHLFNSTGTST
jgi:hypothetical protein